MKLHIPFLLRSPDAAAGEGGGAPGAAASAVVDAAALQAEIDRLKSTNSELEQTAQFWAEKAKTPGAAAPAPGAEAAAADGEEDLLDLITTKGGKGLKELLKRQGFVSATEVTEMVNTKARQLTTEQKLQERHPDLKDESSDFFKATAKAYGELVKQGVSQPLAMEMAVDRVELQWLREGKTETPAAKKARETEERKARAAASAGDRGGGPPPEEESDELSAEQKHICQSMGISEEAYKKRASGGVQMSLKRGGR